MRRALIMALLLAACSGGEPQSTTTTAAPPKPAAPPPSEAQAREIVAGSAELGEFRFTDAGFSLPVDGSMMNEPARAVAKALAREGWVALDGGGDLTLTAKAASDKRFLLRPNGLLDVVPLAKKELGAVLAAGSNPDGTAFVEFTWSWIPNEIGSLLGDKYEGTRGARATLLWDGTSWSVLKIEDSGRDLNARARF